MKLAIVTGSILLALAGPAAAQPGLSPLASPEPPPAPVQPGEQKSEEVALALSLGGTIASWGMFIGGEYFGATGETGTGAMLIPLGALGTMFAPSFGHWYAGKYLTRGLGLRAAGVGTMVAGVVAGLAQCPLFADEPCEPVMGIALIIAGVGLYVGGTIDDIVTAPRRVRRYNQDRGGFAIAPIVTRQGAGLAVGGQF